MPIRKSSSMSSKLNFSASDLVDGMPHIQVPRALKHMPPNYEAGVQQATTRVAEAADVAGAQVGKGRAKARAFTRRPHLKTPRIKTPQVSRPKVSLPQVSVPARPQVSLPQVSLPSRPQVSLPQVSRPRIVTPKIARPRFGRASDALLTARLAKTSRQLAQESSELGHTVETLKATVKKDRKKARVARRRRLTRTMALGAALMYHLDPANGRERRAATGRLVTKLVNGVRSLSSGSGPSKGAH